MIPADSATGQALRSSKEEILFVDVGGEKCPEAGNSLSSRI